MFHDVEKIRSFMNMEIREMKNIMIQSKGSKKLKARLFRENHCQREKGNSHERAREIITKFKISRKGGDTTLNLIAS